MIKRSSMPRDTNQLARKIVQIASGQDVEPEETPAAVVLPEISGETLHEVAVQMGRRGGLKGGPARAKVLSPRRRKQIARLGARTRWAKQS